MQADQSVHCIVTQLAGFAGRNDMKEEHDLGIYLLALLICLDILTVAKLSMSGELRRCAIAAASCATPSLGLAAIAGPVLLLHT